MRNNNLLTVDLNSNKIDDLELRKIAIRLQKKVKQLSVGSAQRVDVRKLSGSGLWPTCTWDLETANLNAEFPIFCASVKAFGGKTTTFRIDDSPNYSKDRSDDSWVIKQLVPELCKYTVAIGYNTQRFDLPFLFTRMFGHNMDIRPLREIRHLDYIWAVRYRMRLHSARLVSALEFLECKTQKTPLRLRQWAQAAGGNRKALDEICKHNVKDCEALEEMAIRLAPLTDMKFSLIR